MNERAGGRAQRESRGGYAVTWWHDTPKRKERQTATTVDPANLEPIAWKWGSA